MAGGEGSQQDDEQGDDQADDGPTATAVFLAGLQEGGAGAGDEGQRGDGDQRLTDANQGMNTEHDW